MRTGLMIAGIVVLACIGNFNVKSKEKVLEVGGRPASVERTRSVPPWIGGLAVIGGFGLVVAGVTRKS